MIIPVSTRRSALCPPLYPEGYFLCPSGWMKDKTIYGTNPTHLQNSDNFVVVELLSQILEVADLYFLRRKISEEFI